MRLSGAGGSFRGFSSGEVLLIGGGVCFGWLNSGETVLTGVEPRLLGFLPIKSFSPEDKLFNCLRIQRRSAPLRQPFILFGQLNKVRCGPVAYFQNIEIELIFAGS